MRTFLEKQWRQLLEDAPTMGETNEPPCKRAAIAPDDDGLLLHFSSAQARTTWGRSALQETGPCSINCCGDCETSLTRGLMPQFALANDLWGGPVPAELQDLTEVGRV